jgi:broad specificity phosphatase PhoE
MTVILLRHGRSTSNTANVLAGRSEGVELDEKGREQAAGLVDRIGELPIRAVVSSPLLRCRQTVEPLAAALEVDVEIEDRLAEVDYGDWTGASERGGVPRRRRPGRRADPRCRRGSRARRTTGRAARR